MHPRPALTVAVSFGVIRAAAPGGTRMTLFSSQRGRSRHRHDKKNRCNAILQHALLQCFEERYEGFLFLCCKFCLSNEIEKLDSIVESQQSAVMQVGR